MNNMKFDEFKKAVVDSINEWLPEEFEGANVSLQVVTKNNDVKLTGLTITKSNSNISPTIYLEQFYKEYQDGVEFGEILQKIAEIRIMNDAPAGIDLDELMNFDAIKGKIMPRLIGTEFNQDLLKQRPHVIVEDLAATFQINLGSCNDGTMSVPITNQLAHSWCVDEFDLYNIAVENLKKANSAVFKSMTEVLMEMIAGSVENDDTDDLNAMFDVMNETDDTMFVLTNKSKTFGAAEILNDEFMAKIAARFDGSIIILPSSCHELIIVKAGSCEICELENMVREVNDTQVEIPDRLSNSVYLYTVEDGLKKILVK